MFCDFAVTTSTRCTRSDGRRSVFYFPRVSVYLLVGRYVYRLYFYSDSFLLYGLRAWKVDKQNSNRKYPLVTRENLTRKKNEFFLSLLKALSWTSQFALVTRKSRYGCKMQSLDPGLSCAINFQNNKNHPNWKFDRFTVLLFTVTHFQRVPHLKTKRFSCNR